MSFDVGRGNVCVSRKSCENIQGHFGHLTCRDVNVIFEILEGNFVIFHKRDKGVIQFKTKRENDDFS